MLRWHSQNGIIGQNVLSLEAIILVFFWCYSLLKLFKTTLRVDKKCGFWKFLTLCLPSLIEIVSSKYGFCFGGMYHVREK